MVGYGNRDPSAHRFYMNIKNLAAHGHWSPNNDGYDISNVCLVEKKFSKVSYYYF